MEFHFQKISLDQLEKITKSLNNSAPGFDDLPVQVFKNNFELLGPVILEICNKSLRDGVFPSQLKTAKVIPLFKKGSRSHVNNYRPVSILTSFSKILEKVVYSQLVLYLNRNNILTNAQHGFRPHCSTENAINSMLKYVYDDMDKGKFIISVFLDLSKAFDTIDRSILLKKLMYYGVRSTALNWFQSYLSERQQYTVFNGELSSTRNIDVGVIQGSTLGPLLFILYMNDIVKTSKLLYYCLYADDTSLTYSHENVHELIAIFNRELDKINKWFKLNHLSLNVNKSNYILFHRKLKVIPQNLTPLFINNEPVLRVEYTKFLGVFIDQELKFKAHVSHVCRKISKFTPIIYKIRKCLNEKNLISIYHALVYPNLCYCISVWGSSYKNTLKPLVTTQKRILRALIGADRMSPSEIIFESLRLLPVEKINLYMTCIYVYKCLHTNIPHCFSYRPATRTLRSTELTLLEVPLVSRTHSQQAISFTGPTIYNNLPLNIRSLENYDSFKINLKHHIRQN